MALINLCALPYSFWSVWYQRFKAKQWCPLCLIVQTLLWITFIVNLAFDYISVPTIIISEFFLLGIIYIVPFLIISLYLPKAISDKKYEYLLKDANRLRMKSEVFKSLLKDQNHYDVNLSTSKIIFGNKEAKMLISVVTNPYCPPCATMHKKIERLLRQAGEHICLQYIFYAYKYDNEELEYANKILAAAYLSDLSLEDKIAIYDEWFDKGKYDREDFIKRYQLDINNPEVIEEVNNHKKWKERTDIIGTPTILVNGYNFPSDHYNIEDIVYFTEVQI